MKDLQLEMMELDLKELQEQIKEKRYELIFNETGLQKSEVSIGEWKCEDSPIGYCVYDNIEDIYHDHCVFCEKPEERG